MATQQSPLLISYEAGADLSALQFHFLVMSDDGQVDGAGDGAAAIGVLQNAPDAAGKVAEIAISGVVKVVAGATIDEGNLVASANDSEAIPAATGDVVLGIAMTGGDAGELVEVLLGAPGIGRTA
jgi:hypothetical protein